MHYLKFLIWIVFTVFCRILHRWKPKPKIEAWEAEKEIKVGDVVDVCGECDHDTDFCERLAAYEDTGLTPENIRKMDKLYQEKCEELEKLRKEIFGYTE